MCLVLYHYRFVRFKSLEEARKAIRICHNLVVDGLTFRVVPAKENMPQGKAKPNVHRQKQLAKQAWSKKQGPAMQTHVPQLRPNRSHSCVSNPPASSRRDASVRIEPPWGKLSASSSSKFYGHEREHNHNLERGSHDLLPNGKMDSQSVSDSTSESSWDDEMLLIPIPVHTALNMQHLTADMLTIDHGTYMPTADHAILDMQHATADVLNTDHGTIDTLHITADMLTVDHVTVDVEGRGGELAWSDSGSVRSEEGGNTSQEFIQGLLQGVHILSPIPSLSSE